MKKTLKRIAFVLPATLLFGCEPEFDDIEFNGGSADFSRTVAVGNSLTAGFQSNALRREKQEVSFPAIVAQQLRQVGGGEFTQPLMDPGVGLGSAGNAEFGLAFSTNCVGETSLAPAPIAAQGQLDQLSPTTFVGADGPFNNVGVPGAKSYHLGADGYGNPTNVPLGTANPFYARFVNPADLDETLIEAALRNNPTFFMLWIGNNDVLGYATSGGNGVNQTGNPDPATYGSNDITDPNAFAGVYQQLIGALTANGAKGIVANIPDVTNLPYFKVVPIGTDAVDQASADVLMNGVPSLSIPGYNDYNAALDGAVQISAAKGLGFSQADADARKINFTGGQLNPFVVLDPSLAVFTDTAYTNVNPNLAGVQQWRQARPGEFMTLVTPGDSLLCAGWGTAKPIPARFHLTAAEIDSINTATTAYNNTIKGIADGNPDIAFVDVASILNQLNNVGLTYDGINFTGEFVSGGAFSMDGVHLSTRGYAIAANEFIDVINSYFNANVPKVSVGDYPNVEVTN